ncbi:DUF2066 domain-containing protein [Methylonatrum kenyense]|uniref:DUF2066 domain-containing protein n=1 Tax=Methylonatrum kenyense TaxID=455253 RepID=UPI0020C00650|nr:DUF2066 domain-containing protein [Methylonatrum kenyense]MCK8516081.1 DUF2066 domain-containing protein [Methylonatrum kenyense]
MRKIRVWLGLIALAVLAPTAMANGLYQVEVLVEDQSEEARQQGVRQGLAELMERLSGREDAASASGASSIIGESSRYLQQFDYGEPVERDGEQRERLRLRFDGEMLEEAMQEAGIPVWAGADRRPAVSWLVVEHRGERQIAGGDVLVDGQQALRRAGERHGLPLTLPLMDLEDQRAMDSSDLWGGFREPILEASARYEADTVIVGRLDQRGSAWQGRWILFRNGDTQELSVQGETPAEVVDSGIAAMARRMTRELAAVGVGAEADIYRVQVRGIGSLSDYAWVQRAIEGRRGVGRVEPDQVNADSVEFRVSTSLDRDGLARELADVRRLEREEVAEDRMPAEREQRPDLRFRLR